jgi:hypothetical protein
MCNGPSELVAEYPLAFKQAQGFILDKKGRIRRGVTARGIALVGMPNTNVDREFLDGLGTASHAIVARDFSVLVN